MATPNVVEFALRSEWPVGLPEDYMRLQARTPYTEEVLSVWLPHERR